MKTIYVPKGETVRYHDLYADRIIVDGCLRVECSLIAKNIGGNGAVHAGKVSANNIRTGYLDACSVLCKRLLAERVDAPEVFASECVVVSGVLSSCMVETPKLTAAIYEVEELKVKDLVSVQAKQRSIWAILFITTLQAIIAAISAKLSKVKAMDADYEMVEPDGEETSTPAAHPTQVAAPAAPPAAESSSKVTGPVDEELNRIVNLFLLSRKSGYTLRLIPGTPEENAPVFDFEQERIIQPAA